jgi:putative endonuclease
VSLSPSFERRRKRLGRGGESLAVVLARARGMRVLARNLRLRGAGEVDVLARRGGLLVLIEVKARRAGCDAAAAVDPRRQTALARCAELLLADPRYDWARGVRFDVVAIERRRIRYLPDAFDASPVADAV